jgi:hypothetical protein
MTPTLLGRMQTRLWLLATVGLLVTLLFASWYEMILFDVFDIPFVILAWVAVIGLLWDVLYNEIQKRRWDSDWPPAYQLFAGIAEGVLVFVLIRLALLPGVPENLPAWMFLAHYATVWFWTFLWTQGPLRILFPQWRFRGGQFGRHPTPRRGA